MVRLGLVCAGIALIAVGASQGDVSSSSDPPPSAGTVPVTLYFHIEGFMEFPINTQAPDRTWSELADVGALATSTSCQKDPTGQTNLFQEFHTFYGYVSPTLVDYVNTVDGRPRIHQERGVQSDVTLADGGSIWWWLETKVTAGGPPLLNSAPLIVPNVVVSATVRNGDAISVGNEAYDYGQLIAMGEVGPVTLAGSRTSAPPSGEVTYQETPEGRHLYGFGIPLALLNATIPRDEGANVRIDVHLDNPACSNPSEGYLMPNLVSLSSRPEARPRWEILVEDPLRIDNIGATWVDGVLVLEAEPESAFGMYDVANVTARLDGPDGSHDLGAGEYITKVHVHGQPLEANYTWRWNPEPTDAAAGQYNATVTWTNLQGTAFGSATVATRIDGAQAAPGPGVLLVMAAIGLGAAMARRR